jgi:hypothetical protein
MVIIFLPTGILGWADLRIKPWLQRYKWNGQRLKVGNKEENETAE